VHLDELDGIVQANDGDSILMAQLLAQHGLAVGISSGANVIGALKAQQQIGADAVVVTVLADSNKKYLSTDLLRTEPVKAGYLTPQVEMIGFDSVNRVCDLCVDPVR
jgi:cysteine synthase A